MSLTIRNPKVVELRELSPSEMERIRREAQQQARSEERTLIMRRMRARLAS
ncbi:hypothetical protein GC722_06970 [Auraticoccus sp. F435]|uniref:Uncharacterized protein n=1 Tax=Auraticoccus cholistanensis TaxID=2656650 RepID=A0A6A9UX06_9ACTN|nr:hypothetical protein [Auraticoccus cholistanensis]MVA75767.1 hypothetical protein [Auraticoccus cholistanensis]